MAARYIVLYAHVMQIILVKRSETMKSWNEHTTVKNKNLDCVKHLNSHFDN